jgi:hypothetical protein
MSGTMLSWVISLGVAGAGALAFLLVTLLTGDYDWVARLGGAAWVFMLAVIILLPTVMPLMREHRAR